MNSSHYDSGEKETAEWAVQVAAALGVEVGGGSYTQPGRHAGEVHKFSLATGLGWLMKARAYQRYFKQDPPAWLEHEHPYRKASLCSLAVEQGILLPPHRPSTPGATHEAPTKRTADGL